MWFLLVYLLSAVVVVTYKYAMNRGETVSGGQLIIAALMAFVPIVNVVAAFGCFVILGVVASVILEQRLKNSKFWNKKFTIKGK